MARDVCRDFDRSSRLEWLDINHTGGYAMGTVAGVNTRRYHALLIASLRPPSDRFSILPRVEERLEAQGQAFELATVQYPAAVQPRGFELLAEFAIDPFPRWCYRAGAGFIEKTLCLLNGQQSVLVQYRLSGIRGRLLIRLLLSFRGYHSLMHRNTSLRPDSVENSGRVSFAPYPDLPALTVLHSGAFQSGGLWFLNHEYLREYERGLDFREDLYSPGSLVFEVSPERPAWFVATLEPDSLPPGISDRDIGDAAIQLLLESEAQRRSFIGTSEVEGMARRALDQFRVVRSDKHPSLIAGYPWFTDWSRDMLISLPALWAAGFGYGDGKRILEMLLAERSQGLLPNRFSDEHSTPEYNSVDATLWMFIAAHELVGHGNDTGFLRQTLYPAARDILDWHRGGTYHGIQVDPQDHLLSSGTPDTQLTWMDARVNGIPVTPRNGKPVEINALWYNALRITAQWANALGLREQHVQYDDQADKVLASFRAEFWNAERDCLYDVIVGASRDARIRPNQLFAASLPFPLLERPQAQQLVRVVERELLTPMGLRTLEPRDPAYQSRFEGSAAQRDGAYHQGTVWPWLIGPFIAAYLYAFGETNDSLGHCRAIVSNFSAELIAGCLGSLAEVYDAEPPQRPAGCTAQLWSIAQFLIAWKRLGAPGQP